MRNDELSIKYSIYSAAFLLGFSNPDDFLDALQSLPYFRNRTEKDKFNYRQLQRIDKRLAKGFHRGRIEQGVLYTWNK